MIDIFVDVFERIVDIFEDYNSQIIALSAVCFTAWQAMIQRKHNRLSVKPHLFTFTKRDKTDDQATIIIQLINNGLGPAFIKKFEVALEGKVYDPEVALKLVLGKFTGNSSLTILDVDYSVTEKQEIDLLTLRFKTETWEVIDVFEKKIKKLELNIEYESIYGEKFSLGRDG